MTECSPAKRAGTGAGPYWQRDFIAHIPGGEKSCGRRFLDSVRQVGLVSTRLVASHQLPRNLVVCFANTVTFGLSSRGGPPCPPAQDCAGCPAHKRHRVYETLYLAALLTLALAPLLAQTGATQPFPDLTVQVGEPSVWQPLLSSVGLHVTRSAAHFRIVVADSLEARQAGFRPTTEKVRVASVVDGRAPKLPVFWENPTEVPVYNLPKRAEVFVREKHTGTPLVAGLRRPDGGILWTATNPGAQGYERFPYLLHALVDLGLLLPVRGDRTWFFFDYSYRTRVDLSYMAGRWRQAGAAALHVSAWHFYESDASRDQYLHDLIEACHREGILVYAWLELPHVSKRFWDERPECREKTATLQDAQLDWRKLVNLAAPSCFVRVMAGVRQLLERFDWDGVNLAELYFESLHGPSNPARFTPMNDHVRDEWRRLAGFDPVLLFDSRSPLFWSRNPASWGRFADYRAELALRLQRQSLEAIHETKPELDLVVTQIDDRLDTRMREYLGADAAALLPLAKEYNFTLVIEDPATVWNLGPRRYVEIARRYAPIAPDPDRLAIDINIVERYQQTYPTKKQVGTELFQLLRFAGQAFSRVMLYFEHSISRPDWPLLPFAAPSVKVRAGSDHWTVESSRPFGVAWRGPVRVNGRPWPVNDGATVWLPAGKHQLTPATGPSRVRMLRFTGDLLAARSFENGLEFSYASRSRAIALTSRPPATVIIDGRQSDVKILSAERHWAILLPRGHHRVLLLPDGLIR